MSEGGDGASYAASGVDIEAGERAVALMRESVSKTAGPDVIGGIGGFAGLFDASRLGAMRRPLLATATDGVGTKVLIAQRSGSYSTIGIDLVGMVVDDLVVCGAEPLYMTDYIVCGKVVPERIAEIVAGIAEGCVQAGCALIGGETAEHPGHFGPDEFDLAGAATGVVEADRLLGPGLVRPGDVVLGLASSGLHSNGFSLVRQILQDSGSSMSPPSLACRWAPNSPRRPGSTRRTVSRSRRHARSGRSLTSRAAGLPRTWPGCCRRTPTPCSTAAAGAPHLSSACWPGSARWTATRWSTSSTWAWA
jgi:hypothetical protein